MLEFESFEVALEFTDLSAVGIHCIFYAVPIFVDLLDDDLGVAICK